MTSSGGRAVAADAGSHRLGATAALLFAAGLVVYLVAGRDNAGLLAAVVYSVLACVGVAALGVRAARMTSSRQPWVLLAAGAALLVLCQLSLVWQGSVHGSAVELGVVRAHPVLAVAGLAAYPLLYGGQMALLRQRVEQLLPSAWLDGVLAALIVMAIALAFAGPPLAHRFDLSAPAVVALLGRPALDLLMLSFALANWSLSGRRSDRRLPMLVAVFALLTLADTAGVLDLVQLLGPLSVSATGRTVDAARLVALLVLVATASPRRAGALEPMPEGSAVLIGPVVSLVSGIGLIVGDRYHRVDSVALFLALTAIAGVGVKFVLLFREVVVLARTRRLALTDDLTGLANRRALTLGLDGVTADTTNDVSLLVIDLDGFKEVNDRHGHPVGDQLLRLVADRLEAVVPAGALVVRLGGDEFAVLLPGTAPAAAHELAGHVGDALAALPRAPVLPLLPALAVGLASRPTPVPAAAPVMPTPAGRPGLSGLTAIGASIGVAHSPTGPAGVLVGLTGEELLRRADLAMYVAKTSGGGVNVYDEVLDVAQHERSVLLDELRAAVAPWVATATGTATGIATGIAGQGSGAPPVAGGAGSGSPGQIVAHYQPQLDTRTGALVGVEALVRWQHPRLGLLAPGAFLDLAEQHGLMAPVTTCMLWTAAEQAVRWRAAGHCFRVSVNLSASSLVSTDLLPLLDDVLARTALPPAALVLEITEATLMTDPLAALDVMRAVTGRGVGLSIDDYGTGYSSLAYLNDLPATELKLDQSFTARLLNDDRTAAIVAATIDLGHRLGLGIVAEGVEDATTLRRLAHLGCDTTQGYLHSRPVPSATLTEWLVRERRRAGDTTVGGGHRSDPAEDDDPVDRADAAPREDGREGGEAARVGPAVARAG